MADASGGAIARAVFHFPVYPEGGIRLPDGSEVPARSAIELQDAVNAHGRVNGYALRRESGANYVKGEATRYLFKCDRAGKPKLGRNNIRNTSSQLTDCGFYGVASRDRKTGN
jgi:hypothetical protein